MVLTEDELMDKHLSRQVADTYIHLADSMETACARSGVPNNTMSRYFKLLPNTVMEELVEYTSEDLARAGRQITSQTELRQLLSLGWVRSLYNFSSGVLWTNEFADASVKHKFVLPSENRFNELMPRLRMFSMSGRRGDDDDVWNQSCTNFPRMREMERKLLQPTVDICMNKKGGRGALDDELVASRSIKDVEKKIVSQRKAGKDGPVMDCIADASIGILLVCICSLRAKGEAERVNVDRCLSRLPTLTHESHSFDMHFDRGYGKQATLNTNVKKGLGGFLMASEKGSGHPFFEQQKLDEQVAKWRASTPTKTSSWIQARIDVVKDFAFTIPEDAGTMFYAASKTFRADNGKTCTLYAFLLNEVHNKDASKILRIFATGKFAEETRNVYVAMKSDSGIAPNLLFSLAKKPHEKRSVIEGHLSTHCWPYALRQRVGNWFLGRRHGISGTNAGNIFTHTGWDRAENEEHLLASVFENLMNSWYKRHPSSEVMKRGSLNEVPTVEQLETMEWVLEFYEVGLLESRETPILAVSPDGIARINVEGYEESQIATVEIKTRQAIDTINHTSHVTCVYDDDVFKECVPPENRKQVMHQAFVTGLEFAVFVTAKLEEEEGSIVQTVIVQVPNSAKCEYANILIPRATKLVGWLHDEQVLDRGYLLDEDFPDWLTNDVHRTTVKTHYRLWAAQRKKVRLVTDQGVQYKPMHPVSVYKHASQFKYNRGKWGLDKNTEMCQQFKLSMTMSFEPKYVHRILRGVIATLWRCEQATTIVKPYILQYRAEHEGKNPSATQIRSAAKALPITDFVRQFGFDSIAHLQTIGTRAQLQITAFFRPVGAQAPIVAAARAAVAAAVNAGDVQVSQIIAQCQRARKWPVKYKKMEKFSVPPLATLRLHSSERYKHKPEAIPQDPAVNKEGRQSCALCNKSSKMRRNARFRCSDCLVPLCTNVHSGEEASHFAMWHNQADLSSAWRLCCSNLVAERASNKRRKVAAAGGEDEEDALLDDEEEEDVDAAALGEDEGAVAREDLGARARDTSVAAEGEGNNNGSGAQENVLAEDIVMDADVDEAGSNVDEDEDVNSLFQSQEDC